MAKESQQMVRPMYINVENNKTPFIKRNMAKNLLLMVSNYYYNLLKLHNLLFT